MGGRGPQHCLLRRAPAFPPKAIFRIFAARTVCIISSIISSGNHHQHSFYLREPEEFFRFYRNKMLYLDAKPNKAHLALASLEKAGKLKAVITQNIDGLHQAAGSREVLELHGSVHRNTCSPVRKIL